MYRRGEMPVQQNAAPLRSHLAARVGLAGLKWICGDSPITWTSRSPGLTQRDI